MTHQAGVRTVVMGGAPKLGAMQAASGNRGAILYDADTLDDDFDFAKQIDRTANSTLPRDRDSGILITYAPFNLRDQVRRNESIPLQFRFLPANCRLYYTLANTYNMPTLWRDAVNATWYDPSRCVQGSRRNMTVGHKPVASNNTAQTGPSHKGTWLSGGTDIDDSDGGIQDGSGPDDGTETQLCKPSQPCKGGQCTTFSISCDGRTVKTVSACLAPCRTGRPCKGLTMCQYQTQLNSKFAGLGKSSVNSPSGSLGAQTQKYSGFCYPTKAKRDLGCPAGSLGAVIRPDGAVVDADSK
jgi:hypothetical protein